MTNRPTSDGPNQYRRKFLKQAATGLAATALELERGEVNAAAGSALWNLSALEAVTAMRHGDITAEAYAGALLARCASFQSLGAFISLQPSLVLEAARSADLSRRAGKSLGKLHGLPLPVKDSVNTKGLPTSSGTAALRGFQPTEDAPALQTLFAQGALLLGKTNLHELSLGYTTNNAVFGPCRNPYDTARSPGGSSGGSAAAVAARLAPLAIAEDTLGSIRVPASMCGVTGMRPSTGRYPIEGTMPITPRFDSIGAVARTVEDLILFDSVFQPNLGTAKRASLKGIRIALPSYCWSELDAEVERVAGAALDRLSDAGVVLIRVDFPDVLKSALTIAADIISFEVIANESAFLAKYDPAISFAQFEAQISPIIRKRFISAFTAGSPNAVSRVVYDHDVAQLGMLTEAVQNFFLKHRIDAMVFPPVRTPPLRLGEDAETTIRGESIPIRTAMARNLALGSCAGMPGLVLPAGLTADGLPVGIEFDVRRGGDGELLALGRLLERALGPIQPPRDSR